MWRRSEPARAEHAAQFRQRLPALGLEATRRRRVAGQRIDAGLPRDEHESAGADGRRVRSEDGQVVAADDVVHVDRLREVDRIVHTVPADARVTANRDADPRPRIGADGRCRSRLLRYGHVNEQRAADVTNAAASVRVRMGFADRDAGLLSGHRGQQGRRPQRRTGVQRGRSAVDADAGWARQASDRHRAVSRFSIDFAGADLPHPWPDDDMHGAFAIEDGDTLPGLVAAYVAECERSRAAIDGAGLDDLARGKDMHFSLRFALLHMIEETSRHCGHLDLLREHIDHFHRPVSHAPAPAAR